MKNYLSYKAIIGKTLSSYFVAKYGSGYKTKVQESNFVKNVLPLLQSDYGLIGDCTITSMSCMLEFIYHKPFQGIYDVVEQIAMTYGYDGEHGTNPLFINSILKKAENKLNVNNNIKYKAAYGKNLGFNYETIKNSVDAQHPLILSMSNDGRNYYTNHSVTVIGYISFLVNDTQTQRFLMLQDNWTKERAYLDYDILPIFCSLNYYTTKN